MSICAAAVTMLQSAIYGLLRGNNLNRIEDDLAVLLLAELTVETRLAIGLGALCVSSHCREV
jgi:hypothetical protein